VPLSDRVRYAHWARGRYVTRFVRCSTKSCKEAAAACDDFFTSTRRYLSIGDFGWPVCTERNEVNRIRTLMSCQRQTHLSNGTPFAASRISGASLRGVR